MDLGHFILLDAVDGMDSVFSFNNYRSIFFIFGCWLLPEKFSVCPKKDDFAVG